MKYLLDTCVVSELVNRYPDMWVVAARRRPRHRRARERDWPRSPARAAPGRAVRRDYPALRGLRQRGPRLQRNLVNAVVANAYAQRASSRAGREEAQGGDTTSSLRKDAVSLVLEIFRRINALNDLEPSTVSNRAALELTAIVEQRKDVGVSRKSQKEPVPPENAAAQA